MDVLLQFAFLHTINTGRTFVPHDLLICQVHVSMVDYPLNHLFTFSCFPVPLNAWLYLTPCSIWNNLMFGPSLFVRPPCCSLKARLVTATTMTSADFFFV